MDKKELEGFWANEAFESSVDTYRASSSWDKLRRSSVGKENPLDEHKMFIETRAPLPRQPHLNGR